MSIPDGLAAERLSTSVPDACVRRFVAPTRIVWATPRNVADAESLMRNDDSVCTLTPAGGSGDAPGVVIDFGIELHGGIRIHAAATGEHRPTRIRVRFGESVAEVMNTPDQDHAIHDYATETPWMGRTEIGDTGFRFVRIDLLDEGQSLPIRYVEAVLHFREMQQLGAFASSDDRLNRIFQTGAWTVQLCCQDYVWDGIKRDRLVWIGDLHPEAMVVSSVFGNHPVVPATLDWARDHTPLPKWMNGIASYSLWWLVTQRDWYRAHGDLAYLQKQKEYLLALLRQLQDHVDENGVEKLDGLRFLEWPTADDPLAIHTGSQGLLAIGLGAAAELCRALGEKSSASGAAELAARVARADISPISRRKQVTALLVLAGMLPAEQANRDIFAVDPYRGLSPFYGYYILQARARAGDYRGALDLIRTFWGGMLDGGATTFWEGFEIDWLKNSTRIDELPVPGKPNIHADFGDYCYKGLRHSLCHGWSAGPTAWLLEHILGVSPASPGFQTVTIQPHLGDLKFARGTYPTPHGLIRVDARRKPDGTVHTDVELPAGVRRTE